MPVDIMVTMIRPDQEIFLNSTTIKYEGLAFVEGILGGKPVTGQAFIEI